jgi:phosphoribosylformylglycinamidine synthase
MHVAIITFPGSNCDYDCYRAFTDVVGVKAEYVWHRETSLGQADAVVLPGGFSYGDYLRAGAIARFSPIMNAVVEFANGGGPVIGICNGFQVLCESHLLPGALVKNRSLKFQGERVWVRVDNNNTMFTDRYEAGQKLHLHIAHGMGNYVADDNTIRMLEDENRVLFRYVDENGEATDAGNANGSMHNIAGIVNAEGNIMGLMPHPERSVEKLLGSDDGLPLLQSLAAHLQTAGVS